MFGVLHWVLGILLRWSFSDLPIDIPSPTSGWNLPLRYSPARLVVNTGVTFPAHLLMTAITGEPAFPLVLFYPGVVLTGAFCAI